MSETRVGGHASRLRGLAQELAMRSPPAPDCEVAVAELLDIATLELPPGPWRDLVMREALWMALRARRASWTPMVDRAAQEMAARLLRIADEAEAAEAGAATQSEVAP